MGSTVVSLGQAIEVPSPGSISSFTAPWEVKYETMGKAARKQENSRSETWLTLKNSSLGANSIASWRQRWQNEV